MPEYTEPGESRTQSDIFQDLLIAHQVGVLRVAGGITRTVVSRMNQLQAVGAITALNFTRKQPAIERAIHELKKQRLASWNNAKDLINKEMVALALWEATWQSSSLKKVLGSSREFLFSNEAASTLVSRTPIRGKTLNHWLDLLAGADAEQVATQIRIGLRESVSPSEITDAIRGTPRSDFSDGISARLVDKVDGLSRTAVVETTQAARELVWSKNRKRIKGVVWSAVLDNRTSEICRGLDGRVAPLYGMEDTLDPGLPRLEPPDKRPPAHFRCRSMMSAIIDGILPRQTSYESWLKGQSEEQQKDILGPRRYNLLITNTLNFNQLFEARSGRPLTLKELKAREVFE
jgi:hypothetical protein